MPRGSGASEVGTERQAKNGYWYVKVEDRGWVLKHWLVWEKANGRLINSDEEQVRFKDGNKQNFTPSNIIVIPKGKVQIRQALARLYIARDEVQAKIEYFEKKLASDS